MSYLEKAVQYTEELHKKNPMKNVQFVRGIRWRNLTKALLDSNRLMEALVYGKKAVELDRELVLQDDSDKSKERVAKSLSLYAETLLMDNQVNEACEIYTEALGYCKSVCEKNDSISNIRFYVKVLRGLYLCTYRQGQAIEAEKYLIMAREEAEKLYERSGAEKDKKLLKELLNY